jgi:hypothetical protein
MLRSLRVPEKLFALAAWAVSFLFASFLIGLGGEVVGDLPGVDQRLSIEQFVEPGRMARFRATRDSLARLERERTDARERAQLALTASENAYQASRAQLPELDLDAHRDRRSAAGSRGVQRTRALDALGAGLARGAGRRRAAGRRTARDHAGARGARP